MERLNRLHIYPNLADNPFAEWRTESSIPKDLSCKSPTASSLTVLWMKLWKCDLDIGDLDSNLSAVSLDGTGHPCFAFLESDIALTAYQGVHFNDPKEVGPVKGSLPMALMRWHR